MHLLVLTNLNWAVYIVVIDDAVVMKRDPPNQEALVTSCGHIEEGHLSSFMNNRFKAEPNIEFNYSEPTLVDSKVLCPLSNCVLMCAVSLISITSFKLNV